MRLGQGFNSYTQEICIDDAVLIYPTQTIQVPVDPDDNVSPEATKDSPVSAVAAVNGVNGVNSDSPKPVKKTVTLKKTVPPIIDYKPVQRIPTTINGVHNNQIVTFSSRQIENVSDIMDSLNISTSASIKYGTVKASGSSNFVNEHNINDSDINFMVSVKVMNEVYPVPTTMTFNAIEGLTPNRFPAVFGDSFIAGFIEGGEFTAIISIKCHNKANIRKVKLAAEMQLAIGPSPISVGAASSLDKAHMDSFKDTETTISVNWSGGGDIKKPDANWDLAQVVMTANEFPNQVAKYSQRISAILMEYRSLRSFQIYNAKLATPFRILDYGLCDLYTADLFSAYMGFKALWKSISTMIKDPKSYKPLPPSKEVPDPIQTDPTSLNLARMECRKGMTLILEETKKLTEDPEIARVGADGEMKKPPFTFPSLIKRRLPVWVGPPLDEEAREMDWASLSAMEVLVVAKYAKNPDLSFSKLVGDPVETDEADHFRAFCSLDQTDLERGNSADEKAAPITHLRIHGHKHHHFDMGISSIFNGQGHRFSHDSEGAIASLAFSTAASTGTAPNSPEATRTTHAAKDSTSSTKSSTSKKDEDTEACKCGLTHHVGALGPASELAKEDRFLSRVADCARDGVGKVVIKYEVGTGRIAAIQVYARIEPGAMMNGSGKKTTGAGVGMKLLEWDMYAVTNASSKDVSRSSKPCLVEVELLPPDAAANADGNDEWNKGKVNGAGPPRAKGTAPAALKPSSSWSPVVGREEVERKWGLVGFWGVGGEVCVRRLGVVWGRV
ncbi:MAG: hypothetical protein Q9160_004329 [Pyrenula sp. 1 TL-2023]